MSVDRFDFWRFTDSDNCWEFVRQFLMEHTEIPHEDIPKLGVLITDNVAKTEAEAEISPNFYQIESPVEYAIACCHNKGLLLHVGVFHNGKVRHATKRGALREPMKRFSGRGLVTLYIHKSLYADNG